MQKDEDTEGSCYRSVSFAFTLALTCRKDKEAIPLSFDDAAESVIDKLVVNNVRTHTHTHAYVR